MALATAGDHVVEIRKLHAAVTAGVAAFLAAFIEFVVAFQRAIGMLGAFAACQGCYTRERKSAVFTIVLCHNDFDLDGL
jgi:hypothetical protein